jgi:hypothetical protein
MQMLRRGLREWWKKLRGEPSFGSLSEVGKLVATVVAHSTQTSSCAYSCIYSWIPLVLRSGSVHLVTSALFLLALVLPSGNSPYPPAPLSNRVMLLKAYVSTCAAWYISQGNGPIPIEEFYAATSDRLTAPPAVPAPPDAKRKPISAPGGPWGRIIANAMAHPEEHVSKTVRSLAVFATRWGSRPRGYFADGDVGGLEGREVLDGTLFVRAANLTLDRLGWAHESGNEPGDWDRESYTTAGV